MRGHFLQRRRGLAAWLIAALAFALLAQPAGATFQGRYPLFSPGSFSGPTDIAIDSDGNIYVVEYAANRVRKLSSSGAAITQWGTGGSDNGQLSAPHGIAIDRNDNVYVADTGNNRIQKFTSDGRFLTTWGSLGAALAQFSFPVGIDVDSAGNVYVADTFNNRVQKFTSSGGFLTAWGSVGAGPGEFSEPYGVATDSARNVFVSDSNNHRVQKFSPTGTFRRTWGTIGDGKGQFDFPIGIARDHAGGIVVSDRNNRRVQRFTTDGAHLASFGSAVVTNPGALHGGYGLAVSAGGMVYVADYYADTVARFAAVPPDTTVTGPNKLIRDATPTYTLTSSQTPAKFHCRIKGSGVGFKACTSPYTTPTLEDGLNVVVVRAIDKHGLIDPTPAEIDVRVDATAPQTWFDSTPGATTTDHTPTFAFSGSERGTFQCSLDGATFAACTSPRTTGSLANGFHTFKVRAKDRAGNVDPTPASHRFEVR